MEKRVRSAASAVMIGILILSVGLVKSAGQEGGKEEPERSQFLREITPEEKELFEVRMRELAKDGISDEEYREGMNQKKLDLVDADQAFRADRWISCASIGVGDGYSIAMQFRQAHPIVAEYHRRVMVFAGDERRGKLAGALQLDMNFGGRTHILLYRHLDAGGRVTHLSFEPRDRQWDPQSIRLDDPDFQDPPAGSTKEYLGLVSGSAYPLKYFSPLVLPESEARK